MSSDISHAVTFDLARGSVHAMGAERAVLVPVDVLFDLVSAAGPDAASAVAKDIGLYMGERIATQLGGVEGVRNASLDAVVNAITLEFSVAGLGVFGIERWGRAMVLVVEHAPRLGGAFISWVLEGAVEGATHTRVACTLLAADPGVQRILLANREATERVRNIIGEGTPWAEALSRLQTRGGE